MAKTPSLSLHFLIKSMSGSEKRYFKLFTGEKEGKDSKYLQLFDAIDQQPVPDEEALKQFIYAGKLGESRKFSELKSYLFELILRCLKAYDTKGTVSIRLQELIQGAQVLYRRSLFKEARQNLAKARKLASKHEEHLMLLEVIRWEKKLAYAMMDYDSLDQEIETIEREERYHLAQYQLRSRYRNTFLKLLISIRKGGANSSMKFHENYKALLKSIERLVLPKDSGHNTKVIYYRLHSMLRYLEVDFEGFHEINYQLMELMEEAPHFLKQEVSEYISVLNNLMIAAGSLGRFEKFELYLSKLKEVTPITKDDEIKIHRQYYTNLFSYCLKKGDFQKGVEALKEHERRSQKYDQSAFQGHSFFFQYFYLYFGAEQYDMALKYLNEWLNTKGNSERSDLQSLARILNILIHHEMGNDFLIQSLVRSAQRYLAKRSRTSPYEEAMMKFFKSSLSTRDKKELDRALENLLEQLQKMSKEGIENRVIELFDMEAWVISKLSRKSFGEILVQKFNALYSY